MTRLKKRFLVALTAPLLVLGTVGMTAASAQAAADPCPDCSKKYGNSSDPNLLVRPVTTPPSDGGGGGSNSLWGGTSNTTLQTGTDSTMLQTGTQSTMLQTGTQSLMLQGGAERAVEQTNVEILVDCSQSMKESLGSMLSNDSKEPKMEAAKRVLEQTMASIPADVNVGLRVFGQSYRNDPFTDCKQTALLVPIGTHNRRAVVEQIRSIHPYGLTPLTYALREAANDLTQVGGRKQIILISDGAETCGNDPCALIHELTARGFNIKVDIVGLGLKNDHEAKIQLNCIAKQSGGQFYDSNTAAELVDNIRKMIPTSQGKVSGKVLTKVKPEVQMQLPADMK